MAGIGFQLNRIARENGLGGIANAAISGTFFSSGPWLLTAGAVLLLQRWTATHLSLADHTAVQTLIVYAFTASAVIAAPIAMIATRKISDCIYADNRSQVPGIFFATAIWATIGAVLVCWLLFGVAVALPPEQFLFAMAILTLQANIWVASPFLTAIRRHVPIMMAYLLGIVTTTVLVLGFGITGPAAMLAALAAGLAATLTLICAAIREEFSAPPVWPSTLPATLWGAAPLGLAGLANALSIWIDKWILWFGPDSVDTIGWLRTNPINDQASFLGLLTLVPGLTLVLVTTETRFSRVFEILVGRCTGNTTFNNIEQARREVSKTITHDLRLLVVVQSLIACICWFLAPEIMHVLGVDARGIFSFRFTVVGTIFHIVAIYATCVLSYYDLFNRVLIVWVAFATASMVATIVNLDSGIASYGWGYMVGALTGAYLALALVGHATSRLVYLLFIGNNPSVVGGPRSLA